MKANNSLSEASRPSKAEFYSLLSAMFFLPLYEVPKNLCLLVFLIFWLINRIKNKDFGGKISALDISVFLLAASGFITAFFTELHDKEWSGPNNLLLIGIVMLMVYRSNYKTEQLRTILNIILFSTVLASIEAYLQQFFLRECSPCNFELHSVGHFNHSAIYVLLAFGISISKLLSFWNDYNKKHKLLNIALAIFFASTCFASFSRAAAGASIALTIILGFLWLPKSKKPFIALATSAVLAVIIAYAANVDVITKHMTNIRNNDLLASRDTIWNTGLTAFKKYPTFGVGMKNYGLITMDKVEQWSKDMQIKFDKSKHQEAPHAHSLYVNTAAEKGAIGLIALFIFALTSALMLLKSYPRKASENINWFFWGSACCAWMTTFGIGLVNTTLHHEHGMLTLILLAISFCYSKFIKQKD